MTNHPLRTLCVILGALFVTLTPAAAQSDGELRQLRPSDFNDLAWRSIGPANMGGRVAAIALHPADGKTWLIGYATGGVWLTTNNGTTYKPIFDDVEETSSIGALAIALYPEDHERFDADAEGPFANAVMYAGTGEGNGRNSSSWGHGVYKSTDGGDSWTHLGLEDTHDITSLAVDPRDPDVLYIAAMGHLWGTNKERGLYKTTDGGETWKATKQVDDDTGCCDVTLDPANPDTVYAAFYQRQRTGWSFRAGSTDGGIYRSDDGGRNWTKLTEGLPGHTGRIGLDVFDGNTDIVYASVESDEGGAVVDEWQNRSRAGGVFRSEDRGDSWERLSDVAPRSFYFSRIRVDPENASRVYLPNWEVYVSDDGGRTFRPGLTTVTHVDFHAMEIDPNDTDRLFVGNDGGFYVSHDRGKTWDFHNHMAVGQFYNVAVDDSDPYRVGGGLQDNGTWIGVAETIRNNAGEFMGRKGGLSLGEWQSVWGGDGFHVAFDPEDSNIMYAEWQGGNLARVHLDSGRSRELKPAAKEGEPRYRFNWNAPFLISVHDHTMLYHAGNHVFKLFDRGERYERISPDLTRNDVDTNRSAGSEAESYNTIVSLAESPLQQGLLWVGTDDGLIHITTDDGESWTDVTPDGLHDSYISKIEASHHNALAAYVAVDGHTSDVFKTIVLNTQDGGKTWNLITGDLPDSDPVIVVREDPRNASVLYIGTEHACYVTIDRGRHWVELDTDVLPTVAVDDLVIQRREMDLVAGTHGRSIWVIDDISPISQLSPEIVQSPFHVFNPQPAKPRYSLGYDGLWSDRMFVAENPETGAYLHYWVREFTDEDVKITITNAAGDEVRTLEGGNRPGINRVIWNLQRPDNQQIGNPDGAPEFVAPGEYTLSITYGDHEGQAALTVLPAASAE